jgi:hypothetical protein
MSFPYSSTERKLPMKRLLAALALAILAVPAIAG